MQRVQELQHVIVEGVLADAPEGGTPLLVTFSQLAGYGSFATYVVTPEGGELFDTGSGPLLAASELRHAMHDPEKGSWFGFRCTVERSGEHAFEFIYDEPVDFDGGVDR